jgi:hypothetical protein
MSDKQQNENMDMKSLANQLVRLDKNIILIFAFNSTGKTRLSMTFKDVTKENNGGSHAGVYYNAYSEDLFYWDNDNENDGADIRLRIQKSSLNQYHASLDEDNLREKLSPYKPKYDFKFKLYDNIADGIESVQFVMNTEDPAGVSDDSIKISRGEEKIFIWCFFLSLFDIQGWTGKQANHFFIDDPVSSLDDHNIFVTASSLMNLVDSHFGNRKIIITTHHVGLFSILADWLKKGEKASSYKKQVQLYILKKNDKEFQFLNHNKDVFLYHLELMQTLNDAIRRGELYAYHFALLRQVLENTGSFLGVGRISYVLEQIGLTDADESTRIINTLSHRNVFRYEAKALVPDNETLFKDIFTRLQKKYNFVLHEGDQ